LVMKSGALNPAATGVRPNSLVAGTALDVADGELVVGSLAEDATNGDVLAVGDGTAVVPQDTVSRPRTVAAARARQSRPNLVIPLSATADPIGGQPLAMLHTTVTPDTAAPFGRKRHAWS
jgi:hypothetical protein